MTTAPPSPALLDWVAWNDWLWVLPGSVSRRPRAVVVYLEPEAVVETTRRGLQRRVAGLPDGTRPYTRPKLDARLWGDRPPTEPGWYAAQVASLRQLPRERCFLPRLGPFDSAEAAAAALPSQLAGAVARWDAQRKATRRTDDVIAVLHQRVKAASPGPRGGQ